MLTNARIPSKDEVKQWTYKEDVKKKQQILHDKETRLKFVEVWLMNHHYNHADWDKHAREVMNLPNEIAILRNSIHVCQHPAGGGFLKIHTDNLTI